MSIKKNDYQNKQITSESKIVKTKISKNVYNFNPTINAPAMQIEADSARDAEEIYQKKIAALSSNK